MRPPREPQEALNLLRTAETVSPIYRVYQTRTQCYLRMRKPTEAVDSAEARARSLRPGSRARGGTDPRDDDGGRRLTASTCVAAAQTLVSMMPRWHKGFGLLGMAYAESGDAGRARGCLERALELAQRDAETAADAAKYEQALRSLPAVAAN